MPKKTIKEEKSINLENSKELIRSLLNGVEDKNHIIINYEWFFDYYKVLNMVSQEFTFRYCPDELTKGFVEITAFNTVAVVAKIPIIYTNIKENILVQLKYIVPYSKFNNNFFVFIFDDKRVSYRYTYNNKLRVLHENNDLFFSLYSLQKKTKEVVNEVEENELECSDDEYNFDLIDSLKTLSTESSNLSCLTEEEVDVSPEQLYRNVNDELIKDVICHLSIDFDHLKDIFNKLGKTRLHVLIKGEKITFSSLSSPLNKKTTSVLAVKRNNKEENDISFCIQSKSITTFKSLSSVFSICPDNDKRIFKIVEFKVIRQQEGSYGITLFPGNFKSVNDAKIGNFDLYNSLMIFIPEDK